MGITENDLERINRKMMDHLLVAQAEIRDLQKEVERLRGILTQVANDPRTWHLHERTKDLLRPFVIEHLDGLPVISKTDGQRRTGEAARTR